MDRRSILKLGGLGLGLGLSSTAFGHTIKIGDMIAKGKKEENYILINNAKIFDGVNEKLLVGNLLVKGGKIAKISTSKIDAPKGAKIIDAGGKFLMPGLSDAHWHVMFAAAPISAANLPDPGLFYADAVAEARRTVLRGFTTVRDMAGSVFGIKVAIDTKAVPGPRIFPSGAFISQTSGHGDFSPSYEKSPTLGGERSHLENLGEFTVANGVPEVLAAVRDNLKKGASQIKIGVSGGAISDFDPLDSTQFNDDEIKAAVGAAADWGTYVCSHVYHPRGIKRALKNGVKSIEHGQLADEEAVKLIAKHDAWLSIQAFSSKTLPKGTVIPDKSKPLYEKWEQVVRWALRDKAKIAYGTDILFSPEFTPYQNKMLAVFADVLSPIDFLRLATSNNAKLLELSGPRNPYKEAKLGVLNEGAWADMILIDGNPLKDPNVITEYEDKFVVIIKDGDIYKNILA
ncbi:hypothetical protein BKH43_07330 [Helicobacter sp. 13S00401-1]|uniref:metal-dependent hydrolase family protein n=1 Tax=Helicobacter sp. 13S00401-1 TaxID=1905758 RepID=UPI000BDB4422|nr:amidohydrolase family protein [Helicobacter sp. 13S00401-1]PAF49049.1 hypothetical protein BKH43_07330 [Helicobacter sp. 13S00401-1]